MQDTIRWMGIVGIVEKDSRITRWNVILGEGLHVLEYVEGVFVPVKREVPPEVFLAVAALLAQEVVTMHKTASVLVRDRAMAEENAGEFKERGEKSGDSQWESECTSFWGTESITSSSED